MLSCPHWYSSILIMRHKHIMISFIQSGVALMLSLVMKDQLKIIELYYTEESIKSIITGNKPKVRCDKRYNTYALKLPICIVASPV